MRVLIASLFLVSCVASPTGMVQLPDKTIIQYHRGGHIPSVMQELAAVNKPVEVHGFCASACTYVLSFENTCVRGDSDFVFHEATANTERMSKAWTRIMFNWYPKKLRDYLSNNISSRRKKIAFKGRDLSKYFNVKKCPNLIKS